MKILHIVPSYLPAHRYGGPIKSVHEMNKGLTLLEADITVYTTNIDGYDVLNVPLNQEVNIDGVKVFYFPISFWPWQYSFAMHKALAENIKNYDLIHITSVFLSVSTLGAYYAKKFKKPYIISPRGNFMEKPLKFNFLKKKIYTYLVEKRNLIGASAVHFTTEKEKDDYLKLGLPFKKLIIIPNSLDINIIVDDGKKNLVGFRNRFGINQNKKIILFMGRLHLIKGLDTLVPVFAEVIKKMSDSVLILAGFNDKNYKKKIELEIENCKLKIGNEVVFTGMLLGDDKTAAFQESDVFVLPSYSENFGMAVVEAMAVGLPVVITKGVGISEEVEQSGAGLVVEKNTEQVTEAILKVLKNPEMAKKMGERGQELVKREFSSDKVAERFLKEYNEIIKKYENSD